jgi:adenylosuccinate lyase
LPDSTQLLDYSIHRMTGIIENLEVDQARVRANLKAQGGVVGSGHVLLALVRQGAPREEAYPRVQAAAHAAMADGAKGFALLLSQDPWIQGYLTAKEIEKLVSMDYQLR